MPEHRLLRHIERRAEQPPLCRPSGRALIDAPIKPERRASNRWLAAFLSLGTLTAAPDALAKPTGVQGRVEHQAEVTPEAAATAAAFERLQSALTTARREQANNEYIRKDVSAERLELAITVIENIPIQEFVNDLSLFTGIPVSELAQDTQLKHVAIYTSSFLASRYEPHLQELEASGDPAKIQRAQELRQGYQEKNGLGGYELDERNVLINIQSLSERAGTNDADFTRRVYRAATHEIIHTFIEEETIAQLANANLNDAWVEEGLVDYVAEHLVERHPLYGREISNSGYIVGPLPAARLLADTLGENVMIRHLIQENWHGIGQAFDAEFGAGTWEQVRATTFPLDLNDDAAMLVPVHAMLTAMGTERAGVIEMSNQAHTDIRLVPVTDTAGQYRGVLVREAELDWKVTNGLVVTPATVDGQIRQLVMSVNGKEAGTPRAETKTAETYYALLAPEYLNNAPADTGDAYVADRVMKRTQTTVASLEF